MTDLVISGSNCYLDCWCTRWDVQDFNVVVETWLNKTQYQDLMNSVKPGAVGELYKILGRPLYYDKTWSGDNTISLIPQAGNSLYKTRRTKVIYPKTITSSPVAGDSGWISVKIEAAISGSDVL